MITSIAEKPQLKYFTFICLLNATILFANIVVVYKIVEIGSLVVSLGTLLFAFTYAIGDIVAEVYGYKLSRQLIWFTLICEVAFTIIISQSIRIPSPAYWHHQEAFDTVLAGTINVAIAHLIAVPTGAFINAYIISKWKVLWYGKHFWIRSLISTAFGEFAFSTIAPIVVWIWIMPMSKIWVIIISTYLIKMTFAVIFTYPNVLIAKWLKKAEGIDIYDHNTDYNPFKLSLRDKARLGIGKIKLVK